MSLSPRFSADFARGTPELAECGLSQPRAMYTAEGGVRKHCAGSCIFISTLTVALSQNDYCRMAFMFLCVGHVCSIGLR
jgi:hypothetical protein